MVEELGNPHTLATRIVQHGQHHSSVTMTTLVEPALSLVRAYDESRGSQLAGRLCDAIVESYSTPNAQSSRARTAQRLNENARAVASSIEFSEYPPSGFIELPCDCVAALSEVWLPGESWPEAVADTIALVNEVFYALVDEDVGRHVWPRDAGLSAHDHRLILSESASRGALLAALEADDSDTLVQRCRRAREAVTVEIFAAATKHLNRTLP